MACANFGKAVSEHAEGPIAALPRLNAHDGAVTVEPASEAA